MSASDSFCSTCEGLCTCRQIQWSRGGGRELRIKRLKFPILGWRAETSERWDAKRASLWGNMGGWGWLEVAAAGLWRQRQSLSCWESLGVLCFGGCCYVFFLLSPRNASHLWSPPPPSLHLMVFQLQALISRCPQPRRAFILYCKHAVAVSSRLSTLEDVYPSGASNTSRTASFRPCACIRSCFINAIWSLYFERLACSCFIYTIADDCESFSESEPRRF